MKKTKSIIFIVTLLILLLGLTTISATNITSDTTATVEKSSDTTNTPVASVEKTMKEVKKETKTHIVNNDTISTVFNNKGVSPYSNYNFNTSLLGDEVNDGDTLDFQGKISGDYNLTINKAVNIISSTQDANISLNTTCNGLTGLYPGNHFIIGQEGSYTNVTGINFYNTQIFVYNSTGVTLDNISAIVEDQPIGGGVGQTSIRENSTNITVKNSYFYTRNNGGSSTLVLAWAENCTILNNTIKADGNVGNLLYLTLFNVEPRPPTDIIPNSNNKILNNTIGTRGQATTDISWTVVLSGANNTIDGNEILRGGIQSQWGGATSAGNTIITNNNIYSGGVSSSLASNLTIENNTFGGNLVINYNATIKNNTFANLTITQETSTVTNNTFQTLNIQRTSTKNFIADNTLSGTANIQTTNNTFINNRIINNDDYTVKVTTSNNNISDNYLVAGTTAGNKTLIISGNNIVENNGPNPNEHTITDETYTNFFDENGYFINSLVEDYDVLTLDGTFNNKNFIFNNTKNTVTGVNCIINNGQIQITDNAIITLNNLTINNDESIDSAIILDSDKNTIANTTINHETPNNVKEILIKSTNNKIIDNDITINSPTSTQDTINVLEIIREDNTINNNNIIVNTNNNAKTRAVYITNEDPTTTITNTISNNKINITSKGESYAVDIDVKSNTNITNNQVTINTNEDIHAINYRENGQRRSVSSNTLNLNTTKNVEAITFSYHNNTDYIGGNNINITGATVEVIKALSTRYTLDNGENTGISSNNINIIADNTTVMTLMGHCTAIQNNITITSPETIVVHFINAYNSFANFPTNKALTVANGTAGIIENSFNTYISGTITTDQAIQYNNVNNLSAYNIGPITSYDEYTMILDSCENIEITGSYLISDNDKKGGDDTVNVINGNNVTIINNKPDLSYLTDETYNTLFDENNIYNSTKTTIYIAPELNDKTMIFNNYVNITCINDAIINGGIIELTENATKSVISNITANNTQFIIKANNTQLTYSDIYQNNENTPTIQVDNAKTVNIRYNNITGDTNNLQITLNNTQTNIEYCNITSLTQTETPLIIADNGSTGNIRNNYLMTNDLIGALTIKSTNSAMTISSNKPEIVLNLTDDNYNNYFDDNGVYNGSTQVDKIELKSNLYNKNLTFNNGIILNNTEGHTIYNGTITLNSTTKITLENLKINNTDERNSSIIATGKTKITNTDIYQEGNNKTVVILDNMSESEFNSNNIISIGEENKAIYFSGEPYSYYEIYNTNITMQANKPVTAILLNNMNLIFIFNCQIIVNSTQNEIPIIDSLTPSDGYVYNNYIESLDMAGDETIHNIYPDSNMPTNTGFKSQINNVILPDNIILNKDNTIIITPTDIFGREIAGTISVTDTETFETTDDNIIVYTPITSGEKIFIIEYNDPTGKYDSATLIKTITVIEPTLIVNPVTATIGETIDITAEIMGEVTTLTDVNTGKVAFKVNGKVLRDENTKKVIYADVVDGVATLTDYLVPENWDEYTTIQAVFTGSSDMPTMTSEIINPTVTIPEEEEPEFSVADVTATAGEEVTITVTTKNLDAGKVVLKVNGKTVKADDGKLYAKVEGDTTLFTYAIPKTLRAGDYIVKAVYTSGTVKLEADAKLTVE